MGGSKRMSMEEKRQVILNIYHSTKQVYTEKEITTLSCKAGVNANTIVDINTSLVDDNLVDKEKIGGTNYFWSFPAKKDRLMQIQHEKTLKNIDALKQKVEEAKIRLTDAKRGREEEEEDENVGTEDSSEEQQKDQEQQQDKEDKDTNHEQQEKQLPAKKKQKTKPTQRRSQTLARLREIQIEKTKILQELEQCKENDPQAIADLEKEYQLVTHAAHRWTDNIFNCKSYLTKKRSMDNKEALRILGITSAFDYPEEPK